MDGEDQDPWRFAVGRVGTLSNLLGSGQVDAVRNMVHHRGLDPLMVRQIVADHAGAQMTPLPRGDIWDEVRARDESGGLLRVRCPIWTELGRSDLSMELVCEPDSGPNSFGGRWIDRLVSPTGDIVFIDSQVGWDQSVDYGPTGGDPRIRRGAFVGHSYGVLFGQIMAGVERARGDALTGLGSINPGLAAVVLLDWSFTRLYGDGLETVYDELGVDDIPTRLVRAASRVRALAYAGVFDRVMKAFPPTARVDLGARRDFLYAMNDDECDSFFKGPEDALYGLEDSGDIIWAHMLSYVEAHGDEFFIDSAAEEG